MQYSGRSLGPTPRATKIRSGEHLYSLWEGPGPRGSSPPLSTCILVSKVTAKYTEIQWTYTPTNPKTPCTSSEPKLTRALTSSKARTSWDFCKGDTRHATTTLQFFETSKKSWTRFHTYFTTESSFFFTRTLRVIKLPPYVTCGSEGNFGWESDV